MSLSLVRVRGGDNRLVLVRRWLVFNLVDPFITALLLGALRTICRALDLVLRGDRLANPFLLIAKDS